VTPAEHLAEAERMATTIKETKAETISHHPDIIVAACLQGILHALLAEVTLHADLHHRYQDSKVGADIGHDGAPSVPPGALRSVPPVDD
jgi:hypothetical protein